MKDPASNDAGTGGSNPVLDPRVLIHAAREGAEPSAENRARVRWLVEQRLTRDAAGTPNSHARSPGTRRFVAIALGGLALAFSGSAAALWWSGVQTSASVVEFEATNAPVAGVARVAAQAHASRPVASWSDVLGAVPSVDEPDTGAKSLAPLRREPSTRRSSGLAEEAALLARAQKATNQGDSTSALRFLDEYDDRYATGALAEERSMARILALCASGQVEAARREAKGYGKRFPNSPQAARLRSSCITELRSETSP